MLTSLVLAGLMIGQAPTVWGDDIDGLKLFCTDTDDSVGVQLDREHAVVYRAGKKFRSFTFPSTLTPIDFSVANGLVLVPTGEKYHVDSGKMRHLYEQEIYAQNGNILRLGPGLTALTLVGRFAKSSFDRFDAAGVSPDGKQIIVIERPMSAPILQTYTFNGREYTQDRDVITPEVEGFGLAAIAPGFNDVTFIGPDQVVFIGGLWQIGAKRGEGVYPDSKGLLTKEPLPMDRGSRRAKGLLFVTDLKSRVTLPILEVWADGSGEPRSHGVGRMLASTKGKYLYLLGATAIWRIETAQILSRIGR